MRLPGCTACRRASPGTRRTTRPSERGHEPKGEDRRPRQKERTREPMIEPKIADLLAQVDSKYPLVTLSAKRAREINSYYNQLGEGRAEFVPPLVETGLRNKPLSIALEEIAEGKINAERPDGGGIKEPVDPRLRNLGGRRRHA